MLTAPKLRLTSALFDEVPQLPDEMCCAETIAVFVLLLVLFRCLQRYLCDEYGLLHALLPLDLALDERLHQVHQG